MERIGWLDVCVGVGLAVWQNLFAIVGAEVRRSPYCRGSGVVESLGEWWTCGSIQHHYIVWLWSQVHRAKLPMCVSWMENCLGSNCLSLEGCDGIGSCCV